MLSSLQLQFEEVPPFPRAPLKRTMEKALLSIPYKKLTEKHLHVLNTISDFLMLVPSHQPGNAGIGVIAIADIPPDHVIGLYLGKETTIAQGKRLAHKKDNAYIMMVREDDESDVFEFAINARDRSEATWTRFINENRTEDHGKTNVEYRRRNGSRNVDVVTTRQIVKGEELLSYYR